MGELDIRFLLRQLGKIHPAPDLDEKVMELYQEWVRGEGKHGYSLMGPSGPERAVA